MKKDISIIKMIRELFVSFTDKYIGNGKGLKTKMRGSSKGMASLDRIIPADIPEKLAKEISETSKKAFRALGSSGVVRIDYLYDKKNKIWEVPCSELSYLIDSFADYDDIDLKLIKSREVSTGQDIQLNKFKTNPFDYQLDGIKYGLVNDKWLLLDAPGLGKSLQLLYIAQELKKKKFSTTK